MRTVLALTAMLVFAGVATAESYEFSYYPFGGVRGEGDQGGQLPEDQGWDPYSVGNVAAWADPSEQALHLLATELDTFKFYDNELMGAINPDPGDFLYVEWSMEVISEYYHSDTWVTVGLDEFGGDASIQVSTDRVEDMEGDEEYMIEPGQPHTFLVRSVNLIDYDLYVDGQYAFSDVFKTPSAFDSLVSWGDNASLYSESLWGFMRYGGAPLGDIDINGLVDFATFAICFTNGGTAAPPGCSDQEFALSDLDNDGDTDLADFATFAVNYTN